MQITPAEEDLVGTDGRLLGPRGIALSLPTAAADDSLEPMQVSIVVVELTLFWRVDFELFCGLGSLANVHWETAEESVLFRTGMRGLDLDARLRDRSVRLPWRKTSYTQGTPARMQALHEDRFDMIVNLHCRCLSRHNLHARFLLFVGALWTFR